MNRRVKIGAWVLFGGAIAAVATFAQGWHYDQYTWPRRIQREILGHEIVEHSDLLRYEGFSHWGQGSFQWTYRILPSNPAIAEYCGAQPVATCHFQRSGKPAPNIETGIVCVGGKVIVEEDWL